MATLLDAYKIFNKKYSISSKFKKSQLIKFTKRIKEKDFLMNNKFNFSPWKYYKIKKFNFYFLSINKSKIIGILVIINTRYSCHLSFLYIDRDYRKEKLGKKLINFFFLITKKKMLTVHVFKKHKGVQNFYLNNGFSKAKKSSFKKYNKLAIWKNRVLKFDNATLKKKYLFFCVKKI